MCRRYYRYRTIFWRRDIVARIPHVVVSRYDIGRYWGKKNICCSCRWRSRPARVRKEAVSSFVGYFDRITRVWAAAVSDYALGKHRVWDLVQWRLYEYKEISIYFTFRYSRTLCYVSTDAFDQDSKTLTVRTCSKKNFLSRTVTKTKRDTSLKTSEVRERCEASRHADEDT